MILSSRLAAIPLPCKSFMGPSYIIHDARRGHGALEPALACQDWQEGLQRLVQRGDALRQASALLGE